MNQTLPTPSADALAISAQLVERITHEIEQHQGWISFARYMELALYAPGLGYYSGGAAKIGQSPNDGSDFSTAPEISALFGRTLARQIAPILKASAPQILEFGAGTGKLAADILLELERMECLPDRYAILDLSADLRERQSRTIATQVPHLLERIVWLDELPGRIDGAVIANEVLDAIPVNLIVKCGETWQERGVALNSQQQLVFSDRVLDTVVDASLLSHIVACIPHPDDLPNGYATEINPGACAFVATLSRKLHQGAVILIDYGFPQAEYYHPQRAAGTFMAHYRHHAHADPFLWPGLQDITSHVDFSAIAQSAFDAQADLYGYLSQARFLINCGITALLSNEKIRELKHLRQINSLHKLISEAEMGELFKILAFGRGIDITWLGFLQADRLNTL